MKVKIYYEGPFISWCNQQQDIRHVNCFFCQLVVHSIAFADPHVLSMSKSEIFRINEFMTHLVDRKIRLVVKCAGEVASEASGWRFLKEWRRILTGISDFFAVS